MSIFKMSIISTENPDNKLFIIFPTTSDILKKVLNDLGLAYNSPPEKYRLMDFESYGVSMSS